MPEIHDLVRLMRPRQWVKNFFVLAPLLFAGQFLLRASLVHAGSAFALFCLASSATYVLNDLRDVEQDRRHPRKARTRPIAAGKVSPFHARLLLGALCLALLGGFFLEPRVMCVILAYLGLNLAYSFGLKRLPVIDIFTIAIGFVLRVYAGAAALRVPLSGWMFVTTLTLALYLAAVKRRQELLQNGVEGRKVLERYSVALINHYAEMSATGTLVFYSLFILTAKPALITTIPLVIFGLFRYGFLVEAGEGESPSDSLLADGPLMITVLLWVGACLFFLWPSPGL